MDGKHGLLDIWAFEGKNTEEIRYVYWGWECCLAFLDVISGGRVPDVTFPQKVYECRSSWLAIIVLILGVNLSTRFSILLRRYKT